MIRPTTALVHRADSRHYYHHMQEIRARTWRPASAGVNSGQLATHLLCRTAYAGVTLLTGMGWARNAGAEGRKVGGGTPSRCTKFHQLLTDKWDMRSVVSRPGLDDAVITQCSDLSTSQTAVFCFAHAQPMNTLHEKGRPPAGGVRPVIEA
ncbi:hypothetical protein BGZ61DRAFT_442738 [Ilyonectria robusta]|uniref:uncharacterized protein n=1 Tax=Ilyonectria robusta TaxID=1079257 RepID=UPI001E8D142E|nr:uncharacterized protein BGZ61DRAFT_442738 [Ilyonectria robusta]KAH8734553.1 hypothetical protein BGZ61DRAFT_442738 [Ilyonectria robusta]